MRGKLLIFGVIFGLVAIVASVICVKYYEYVFARTIQGKIMQVERVSPPEAIITGGRPVPSDQLFSFAVAIRAESGEIFTSSSEDRQWAVAASGQCVEARLYPYAPWDLGKGGTYHGARLRRLFDCPN